MENLKDFQNIIEKRLEEVIHITEPVSIFEPFKYIMSGGGKRLRPTLTMLACGAISGHPEMALDAGIAVEIVHNYTLVHDDIMDNSPIRRGRETIHKKWDIPTAILTGDFMASFAMRLLETYSKNPHYPEIVKALNDGIYEVCSGQAFDMDFSDDKKVSLDKYIKMIDKKTAKLLQTAVLLGVRVAGAREVQVLSFYNFAYYLGLAFQIQDDILDLTAEQAKLGKKIGQDLLEGKKTYLILTLKDKKLDDNARQLLDMFYENNGLSEEYIPKMKDTMLQYNVITEAEQIVEKYLTEAISELGSLPQNHCTILLKELTKSLNKRSF